MKRKFVGIVGARVKRVSGVPAINVAAEIIVTSRIPEEVPFGIINKKHEAELR